MSLVSYRMFLKDGTEIGRASIPGYIPWGYKISFFVLNQKYVTVEPVREEAESVLALMSLPLREAREVFERGYIASHLSKCDGNISRTSESAGVERSLLYRKMKRLGMIEKRKSA